jgi:hypothetical protein
MLSLLRVFDFGPAGAAANSSVAAMHLFFQYETLHPPQHPVHVAPVNKGRMLMTSLSTFGSGKVYAVMSP